MTSIVKIKDVHLYSALNEDAHECYLCKKLLDDSGVKYTHLHYPVEAVKDNLDALSTWPYGREARAKTFTKFPIIHWTEYHDDFERFVEHACSVDELKASSLIANKDKVAKHGNGKTSTAEQCEGFTIYRLTASEGSILNFKMTKDDISIGAFYDGAMVVTEAANPAIIGTVFEGFFDFSQHPELNTIGSWMNCKVTKEMKDWYCVHSDVYTNVAYVDAADVKPGDVIYRIDDKHSFVLS